MVIAVCCNIPLVTDHDTLFKLYESIYSHKLTTPLVETKNHDGSISIQDRKGWKSMKKRNLHQKAPNDTIGVKSWKWNMSLSTSCFFTSSSFPDSEFPVVGQCHLVGGVGGLWRWKNAISSLSLDPLEVGIYISSSTVNSCLQLLLSTTLHHRLSTVHIASGGSLRNGSDCSYPLVRIQRSAP